MWLRSRFGHFKFPETQSPRKIILLDRCFDSLPFDRIICPDLHFIGQAWLDLPREAGEKIPRWRTFRPIEYKSVIHKINVMKVEDWQNHCLEFSVYSEHSTEFIGGGRRLRMSELRENPATRDYYNDIHRRIGRSIENSAPQYVRKTSSWNDQGFIEYEVLMLPFLPENGVTRILQPISARMRETPEI